MSYGSKGQPVINGYFNIQGIDTIVSLRPGHRCQAVHKNSR